MAVGYDMFASIMTTQTLKHFTFTSITKFFVAPIFLLLYLALPISVHAKVVINEVFANPSGELSEPTEFIELYSDEAIDLEGYTLYMLYIKKRVVPVEDFFKHEFTFSIN